MSWITVYDLREDPTFIKQVQEATLNTEHYGVEPTHGLFGSDEWWQNIASAALPLQRLSGEVTRVWMGSMGDWPMFEMRSEDGSLHEFTRMQLRDGSLDGLYSPGRHVEVDFIWQARRKNAPDWGLPKEGKQVIAIRLEE